MHRIHAHASLHSIFEINGSKLETANVSKYLMNSTARCQSISWNISEAASRQAMTQLPFVAGSVDLPMFCAHLPISLSSPSAV